MTHELKPVTSPEDWRAMHDIRLATLFVPGRHGDDVVYDENHPHDRAPGNQCFLFFLDGLPAGVFRLDRRGDAEGVVRLVGIAPALQRAGHGRAMSEQIDAEAWRRGMARLLVNAHKSAVGFYEKTGWHRETWDEGELFGLGANCVQMTKSLA